MSNISNLLHFLIFFLILIKMHLIIKKIKSQEKISKMTCNLVLIYLIFSWKGNTIRFLICFLHMKKNLKLTIINLQKKKKYQILKLILRNIINLFLIKIFIIFHLSPFVYNKRNFLLSVYYMRRKFSKFRCLWIMYDGFGGHHYIFYINF